MNAFTVFVAVLIVMAIARSFVHLNMGPQEIACGAFKGLVGVLVEFANFIIVVLINPVIKFAIHVLRGLACLWNDVVMLPTNLIDLFSST